MYYELVLRSAAHRADLVREADRYRLAALARRCRPSTWRRALRLRPLPAGC